MTFTTSTDPALADGPATDLGPFFKRYDRRNRLVLGASLAAGLALSAVIAEHLLTAGAPAPRLVGPAWAMGVVIPPLLIAGWWTFGELIALGRRKDAQPDGRYPAGADDARNGVRLANAGFAFNLVLLAATITGQVLMLTAAFGYPVRGDLITRAIMVVEGAVTIYLGNLWPRMPTPRAPERIAAIKMKANRVSGWVMVVAGLLMILLGLFLPLLVPGLRHPR
jgi:hypothetical protein